MPKEGSVRYTAGGRSEYRGGQWTSKPSAPSPAPSTPKTTKPSVTQEFIPREVYGIPQAQQEAEYQKRLVESAKKASEGKLILTEQAKAQIEVGTIKAEQKARSGQELSQAEYSLLKQGGRIEALKVEGKEVLKPLGYQLVQEPQRVGPITQMALEYKKIPAGTTEAERVFQASLIPELRMQPVETFRGGYTSITGKEVPIDYASIAPVIVQEPQPQKKAPTTKLGKIYAEDIKPGLKLTEYIIETPFKFVKEAVLDIDRTFRIPGYTGPGSQAGERIAKIIPTETTEILLLGAGEGYLRAGEIGLARLAKTAGIIFNEPISQAVSKGIGTIIPVQDTGFAPSGALPQIGRGALYSASMLIPGVSTAFISNLAVNAVTDPVRTVESVKEYVMKNPYEIASLYGFSKGIGRVEQVLARNKMYYDITDRLVNQYGSQSPEVINFQKAWKVAFEQLPKRVDVIKQWSPEQLKAIAKEPVAQRIVADVVKKYNPTIIGSSTLLPYLSLRTLRRGLQGDIDVQTVQGLLNIQSKAMAQELYTRMKQARYDVKYYESKFDGHPKYHVTLKGQELLNAGTSYEYFLRTQLGPLRGLFEPRVFGQTVITKEGIPLGGIRGQLRIKLVKGYGGDISRIRELERLSKEGKLEGREKDILDTMDIIEGTKSLFENEKYVGRIAPYNLKTLIFDIREAVRESTYGRYVLVKDILSSRLKDLGDHIERILSIRKAERAGPEVIERLVEEGFRKEIKNLIEGEKVMLRPSMRAEPMVKSISDEIRITQKKLQSEIKDLESGRVIPKEAYPLMKPGPTKVQIPKYERELYKRMPKLPEIYPTGYKTAKVKYPTTYPIAKYNIPAPKISYPKLEKPSYPTIPKEIKYPTITTPKYPTIPSKYGPGPITTKYPVPKVPPKKPTITEKPIILPFEEKPIIPKRKAMAEGYWVYGKSLKSSKFFKINNYPLVRSRAQDVGAYYVANTLARTFRIEKTGREAQPDYQFLAVPEGFFQATRGRLREYRIRQRRIIPTQEQYIQKAMFALSSEGEKKQIQAFRKQAMRILG